MPEREVWVALMDRGTISAKRWGGLGEQGAGRECVVMGAENMGCIVASLQGSSNDSNDAINAG